MNMSMPALVNPMSLRPARQRGFTLIEMMISITIGLGILAGLVGVLATNSSNSRTNDRTSELMTNGRYALDSMKKEIREAGFRGYTYADPALIVPSTLGSITSECLESGAAAGSFVANMRQGIWGANNTNPFSGSCIPTANFASGNDVMVVRRLAVLPTAPAANTIYFASSYARGEIYRGATAPAWSTTAPIPAPVANFVVQNYVYYIRPWTVSATESPQIPALVRVSLQESTAAMVTELVASGIEHLQVQYGRLSTAGSTQFLNAGAAPLTQSSSYTDSNEWDDINSVRLWLLARNTVAEPGYANTNTYAMGDQSYTVSDSFRRQLFTTVVQLRNN